MKILIDNIWSDITESDFLEKITQSVVVIYYTDWDTSSKYCFMYLSRAKFIKGPFIKINPEEYPHLKTIHQSYRLPKIIIIKNGIPTIFEDIPTVKDFIEWDLSINE